MDTDVITHIDQLESKTHGEVVTISRIYGNQQGIYIGIKEGPSSYDPKRCAVLLTIMNGGCYQEFCFPSRKGTFPRREENPEGSRWSISEDSPLVKKHLEKLKTLKDNELGVKVA